MWNYSIRFVNIVIIATGILSACGPSPTSVIPTRAITGIPISSTTAPIVATPSRPSIDQNQVAQLSAIIKMRGHLLASYNLWTTKLYEEAYMHTNEHILDELFYAVRSPLKSKNADLELQDKLLTYSKSANKTSTAANIDKNYKQALTALNESYVLIASDKMEDWRLQAAVVRDVLDSATSEYDEAVDNDKVVNAEEWQDTLGFLNAALELYSTSIEPSLKESAAEKAVVITSQFTTIQSNFGGYSKFPNKVTSAEQFNTQVDNLIQTITQAANLPPMIRTAKYLTTMQRNIDQALTNYRNGKPDIAYEFIIKSKIDGLEKISGDLASRDANLMAAFEAQFNILSEAIKTRAPLKKVETDANALTEFFEKALKIAAPSKRPGSKH